MKVEKTPDNKNDGFGDYKKLNDIIETGKLKNQALKKILLGIEKTKKKESEKPKKK